MIKTGIDVIQISRFSQMKNIDLFKKYAFTLRERQYFNGKKNPFPSIAAAFAAKEAFAKYMGSGLARAMLKFFTTKSASLTFCLCAIR